MGCFDAVDRCDGSFVDRLGERRSMQVVQPRGLAGSHLVDETVEAVGVELDDPIPHDLQRHAAILDASVRVTPS